MTPVSKSCKPRQLFHYVVVIVLLVFAGCNTSVNLCSNKIYIVVFSACLVLLQSILEISLSLRSCNHFTQG